MIGVDTNFIIRLLTRDDEKQFLKAEEIIAAQQVFIADTVLLETEWVLRFAYKFKPDAIREGLTKLLGLAIIHVNYPEILYQDHPTVRKMAWFCRCHASCGYSSIRHFSYL